MTNPLLNHHGLPKFQDIQPEHVKPAIDWLITHLEKKLSDAESSAKPTWDSTGKFWEDVDRQLEAVWGPIRHLIGVKNSPELREVYGSVQGEIVKIGLKIAQSKPIYQAAKSLQESPDFQNLTEAQQRVITLSIRNAKLHGIELEGEAQKDFNKISSRLTELGTNFSNNVLDSTKDFSLEIKDPASVKGMPASFLQIGAQSWNQHHNATEATPESGPWLVTLDLPSYLPFVQHCPDQGLREKLYRAYMTRASSGDHDNSNLILEILRERKRLAELVGFSTYADYSLASKMAGDVKPVFKLLNQLLDATKPAAEKEHAELTTFAHKKGFVGDLKPWDIAFYAEKMREELYDVTDDQLRPYFPLPKVLNGLFKLVETLFDIKVQISPNPPATWEPDVSYFQIYDQSNTEIAGFFLDPYSRPKNKRGGAWMDTCINRGYFNGKLQIPVAYLICNGTPPVGDKPSLLTFREVETLFHEFGHGLQHMLTKIDYSDVSGINGIEWDAVELPSQFMENWCYHKPTLLGLTSHISTGEKLPDELFEKIYQAKNYRAASQMLRQLHFGFIDMILHHEFQFDRDLFEVDQEVAERLLVTPRIPEDRFLCSFSHIFAGGYAAGYYSYKWAEVLSADAFSAFEEAGLDDQQAVKKIGNRFRDTVLAKGGSRPPEEVFREFRGRDQKIDALLKHSGL